MTKQDTNNNASQNQNSDPTAEKDRLERGLRLVYAVAARVYKKIHRTVEYDELVSLGTIGLMQAASRYDASSEAAFTTFAYYRIHGAMMDGLRKLGPLPRDVWRRRNEPEDAETAERAISPKSAVVSVHSFEILGRRGQAIGASQPTVEKEITSKRAERLLHKALSCLSERQSYLIRNCYYGERKLCDAGRDLGISKSWTSRLHGRALKSLRAELSNYSYDCLAA